MLHVHPVRLEAVQARRSASDVKPSEAKEGMAEEVEAAKAGKEEHDTEAYETEEVVPEVVGEEDYDADEDEGEEFEAEEEEGEAGEDWLDSLVKAEQARDIWRWGAERMKEGEFEEALEALDCALDLFMESAALENGAGPIKKAQAAVQARVLQDRSHAKCRLGLLEEGLSDLESADALEPDNKSFLTMLGAVSLDLDRPGQAEAYLERAAGLAGTASPGYFTLTRIAAAKYRLGKFQEAIAALDSAAKAQPLDASALVLRGEAKRELGQLKGALRDFNAALNFAPEHVGALRARGELQIDIQKYPDALEDLKLADSLSPGDALTVINRARAQLAMSRVSEALADLDRADALLRGSPAGDQGEGPGPSPAVASLRARALLLRGQAKLALGRAEEGLADVEEANALQPNDAATLQDLGRVELQLGQDAAGSA